MSYLPLRDIPANAVHANPRDATTTGISLVLNQAHHRVQCHGLAARSAQSGVLAGGAPDRGPFNNYAVVQGVDHIVPANIYLPGCPPRPEMLMDAILKLRDKVEHTRLGAERDREIA
jgi:Ni,Fe-hydrogenase III small subunit